MRSIIRQWKGALLPHDHDFRLGETSCRVFGCAARQIIHEHDEVLGIFATALKQCSIDLMAAWLIAPRGHDGGTVVEMLIAGEYDRVRMLALTALPGESMRRQQQQLGSEGG